MKFAITAGVSPYGAGFEAMKPVVAMPVPHSTNHEYSARALSHYRRAVQLAGAEPLTVTADNLAEAQQRCAAVLLPGSRADVDPARYHAERHPECAPADPGREELDWELLKHAYAARIPVLGVCYGLQSLNVYRGGTLLQHIAGPHENKAARHAHSVQVESSSRLAAILGGGAGVDLQVNSSHHQSAAQPGNGLRAVAVCPDDEIIEALESTSSDHFVVAVQWHPERSLDEDASLALFRALIHAAK
jgi:putative glutamine amidotransferase